MRREPGSRPTPLDELRVVEISDRIAGSYCGKLLVDAGAQVRKIEPPQGDWLRRYSATGSPVPDGETSPFFSYLNAGKRSLTIAEDAKDLARYRAELATADVVVVTAGRSQAAALGIDPPRLLAESPRVTIVTMIDRGDSARRRCGSIPSAAARARPAVTTTTSAAASMARYRAKSLASSAIVRLRLPALR